MAANKNDDSTARTNNNGSDTVAPRRRQSTILPKPTDLSIADFGGLTKFPASDFGQQRPGSQEGSLPPLYIPGHTEIFFDGQPVKSYEIVGFTYRMIAPDNENRSSMIRQTISRVTLRYELHIIQGPKRARACGSGPRSAADRRPVDPPPVVQLKIFDQDSGEDITSVYDSGFMLYASLENARPIAHGRFHPGGVPVLTGVAVASPAYLDKPEKAAYFIFPDLSVRHEGWYRLRFSLFEGVKKTYDADPDRPILAETDETRASREVQKHQGMANRMEVVSEPFQVFSAKKFPGLKASTTISQDMADQGCRVRIRREIRQRKRAVEKPEAEGVAAPYMRTPDTRSTYPDYARSDSRNSVEHLQKMRRASDDDWQRPTPSRALSVASMSQASPLTPSASQIPMGPPPTRQDWISPRTTYDPVRHNITLPSMQVQHPENRQYSLFQSTPTKRTHSPSTYEEDRPMKAGSRPSDLAPPLGPVDHSATIEVDENPSSEEYLKLVPYNYASASSGTRCKMGPPLKEV